MPLIELQNITKNYKLGHVEVTALRNINLIIQNQEFCCLYGASGSGKTTLLNIVGLIDNPLNGNVMFDGHDVSKLSASKKAELRNRNIGYIFQTFNLIPVLSALENVIMPLQIRGVKLSEANQRGKELLAAVGLKEQINKRPDTMSGGQRQRVAIARALIGKPALVLADEPTANLDSENSKLIISLMRELNKSERTAFIFSTHDQELLASIDRKIQIKDGTILKDEVVKC